MCAVHVILAAHDMVTHAAAPLSRVSFRFVFSCARRFRAFVFLNILVARVLRLLHASVGICMPTRMPESFCLVYVYVYVCVCHP